MFEKQIENFKKLNEMQDIILSASKLIKIALENGNKILLCGNVFP